MPIRLIAVLFCITSLARSAYSVDKIRIKDITSIGGVRTNKLTGFGLVSGLNGTGGKSPVTRQLALAFIERQGQRADPALRRLIANDTRQKTDNLSVVVVTAELPAFAKRGSKIDVVVSAFDDAKSLQGGILMLTPLRAVDGEVYVAASGPVSIGGFSFSGNAASVVKNHPTTGKITGGGQVERVVPTPIGNRGSFRLLLDREDFETARRIRQAVRDESSAYASIIDAGTIEVRLPREKQHDMISQIGVIRNIRIVPDTKARVVINERTGTVVIGENVKISKVAITHGNLAVINTENPIVSQPAPFSQGTTTPLDRTNQVVVEEKNPVSVVEASTTVGDLVRALNALGVTPRDLSSVFQQLKASGALHADLEYQ